MDKKDKLKLSESDICDLFITPAIKAAKWDPLTQIRREVTLTPGPVADKPSRAEIHLCSLWSESGQTRVRLDYPLCAITGNRVAFQRHGNWDSFGVVRGARHETSPSSISASGSGFCRAPGRFAGRPGADLSDATGAYRRRLSPRPNSRYQRAPNRPMAVGAPRPAIRH